MLTKFPSNFIFFDLVFEIKLRAPKSSFFSSKKSKKDKFDFFSNFCCWYKVHIIQKNGEKLFSLKSTFVGKNSQKSILYKRKKVVFSFFRPYYTNFIFFTTYHKCMHKRFFLGRRKRMYTAVAVVGSVLPFLFLKDGFMSCASFMLCCVFYIAMFCCCLVLI